MIPVEHEVAKHKKWLMPAPPLYRELVKATSGRVLRSDTGWPEDKYKPDGMSNSEWMKVRRDSGIRVEELYIDFELR
jgi:hypothetical protein